MLRRSALKRKKSLKAKVSNPLRRGKSKSVNRQRKKREWARSYGSEAFVRWMQAGHCVIDGNTPCEVAHIPSKSGMSRKGDYTQTVRLCPQCHRFQHAKGWGMLLAMSEDGIARVLPALAAKTQQEWKASQ